MIGEKGSVIKMMFGVHIHSFTSTQGYHKVSRKALEDLFLKLKEIGIGGLEIYSGGKNEENPKWENYLRNLRDLSKKYCVRVSMHAPYVDLASTDEKIRKEAVNRTLKAMKDLEGITKEGIIVIHPEFLIEVNIPWDSAKIEERKEKSIQSLKVIFNVSEKYNLKIALENQNWRNLNNNEPTFFSLRSKEILRLAQMFSEKTVGVCFDVGHANNGTGDELYEDLRECSHRLIHVHLHDNHGFHKGDEHLEPGEGIINFNKVYRILKEIRYNGVVLLEISSTKKNEAPFQFYERNYEKFIENVRLF